VWLQIRTIDRKQEVPHDGAMCDLLWSDPGEQPDNAQADMTIAPTCQALLPFCMLASILLCDLLWSD
jgi:diadenosine tetraphosphatase ApaH/serine/threonine PP2A family protein phosphatase